MIGPLASIKSVDLLIDLKVDSAKYLYEASITYASAPQVFTYKPATYNPGHSPLVLVHHGMQRDAVDYRDYAISMAEATGALIASPLLDKERCVVGACVVCTTHANCRTNEGRRGWGVHPHTHTISHTQENTA